MRTRSGRLRGRSARSVAAKFSREKVWKGVMFSPSEASTMVPDTSPVRMCGAGAPLPRRGFRRWPWLSAMCSVVCMLSQRRRCYAARPEISERSGALPKCCFHSLGVSCATSAAGC